MIFSIISAILLTGAWDYLQVAAAGCIHLPQCRQYLKNHMRMQGVCRQPSGFVIFCDAALPGEILVGQITAIKKGESLLEVQ